MTAEIALTRGLVALVDDGDFDRVSQIKWHAHPQQKSAQGWYAVNGRGGSKPSKNGRLYLHRFILNAEPGQLVDHVNGIGLDCRRANLRFATRSQNCINRVQAPRDLPRGVVRTEYGFRAFISHNGRRKRLGTFRTPEEAAAAYEAAAIEMHGAFALGRDHLPLLGRKAIAA